MTWIALNTIKHHLFESIGFVCSTYFKSQKGIYILKCGSHPKQPCFINFLKSTPIMHITNNAVRQFFGTAHEKTTLAHTNKIQKQRSSCINCVFTLQYLKRRWAKAANDSNASVHGITPASEWRWRSRGDMGTRGHGDKARGVNGTLDPASAPIRDKSFGDYTNEPLDPKQQRPALFSQPHSHCITFQFQIRWRVSLMTKPPLGSVFLPRPWPRLKIIRYRLKI